jgi:hypothetical protein
VGQIAWFGVPGRVVPRPALVAAGAAAAAMFLAGVAGTIRVNREMKAWIAGDHPWVREDVAARMGPVLARWTYARDEWEAYTEREYAFRSREAWGFGVFAAVLGAAVTMGRGAPWEVAAGAAAALFVVGFAGWRGWALRMRRRNRAVREPSVVIASNAVLIDGKRDYLGDERTRTSDVRFVEAETPPVLEITVSYPGRVMQNYTMRIPVPRGGEAEARELVARFRSGRWSSPPRPGSTS